MKGKRGGVPNVAGVFFATVLIKSIEEKFVTYERFHHFSPKIFFDICTLNSSRLRCLRCLYDIYALEYKLFLDLSSSFNFTRLSVF